MPEKKDQKKVAAGRKGGKMSPSNFKNNRALASRAGLKSALFKSGKGLARFPIKFTRDIKYLEDL